jgi:hypothetical protein
MGRFLRAKATKAPTPSAGMSTSSSDETLATSAGGETLESYTVSNDSASASSIGGDDTHPSKSASYFITAMPYSGVSYFSPTASIEESYPFESSRFLSTLVADPPLETTRKSILAGCEKCGKDGMTSIHYRHFTRKNILLAVIAPLVAPCLLTSAGMNQHSIVEHKCASCGAKVALAGSSADVQEEVKKANDDAATKPPEKLADTTPSRQWTRTKSGRRAREVTFSTSGPPETPQVQVHPVEQMETLAAARLLLRPRRAQSVVLCCAT